MADVRDEISIIEKQLVKLLGLAYKFRYPEVADLSELQALNGNLDFTSAGICIDKGLRFVRAVGRVFEYDGYSLEIDDGLNVIKPFDIPDTQRGRWIRQDTSVTKGPNFRKPLHIVQTGYAKAVEIYEGQLDLDEALIRIMSVVPAFLVQWTGDEYETKSITQGALYLVKHKFSILCISSCLRPDASALLGSPFPSEYAFDPGLNRMMGDVRYLLAGSKLGLPTIDYTVLGNASIVHEDWDSRLFMGSVELIIRDTVNIADEDLIEFKEIAVFPHLTESKGPVFNLGSYIASGLRVPTYTGLSIAPDAGSVYINGNLINVTPTVNLFTANSDTYRDLDLLGNFIYTAVPIASPEPEQPSGTFRVGFSRSDSTNIVFDAYLADSNVPFGSQYVISET